MEKVKKITLGGVLSWIFGTLFILSGVGITIASIETKNMQLFISALVLFFIAFVLLPPSNKFMINKLKFELSRGIKIAVVIVGLIVFAILQPDIKEQTEISQEKVTSAKSEETEKTQQMVVSTSFEDFEIVCDSDATNLQKRDVFDKKFKDNYVEWTGTVSSISESLGQYTLQVKHCPYTFTSDILVTMRKYQKDKLLKFKEGDQITYRAKLTRLGDILGLSATDGIVVEK